MNTMYYLILISHLMSGIGRGNDKIDEIITQHKKAIGYQALAEIQSLVLIGEKEVCIKQYDTCFTSYYIEKRKRPELFYYESETLGHKVYEGFDGKNLWSRSRLYDNIDYFDISRYKANLDGLVYLYNRGWIRDSKLIMGEKKVLELDIYTDHNQQIYVRLNPKTYLITSILFENFDDNKRYTSEFIFSKYRRVKKIKLPFKEEFIYNGELFSILRFNKILVNQDVKDDEFKRTSHVKE